MPIETKESRQLDLLVCRKCGMPGMIEVNRTQLKPLLSIIYLKCSTCGALALKEQDHRGWNSPLN